MPAIPQQPLDLEPDAIRVLITGFGPFSVFTETNPSWLAVRPLQNTILYANGQSPALPITHHGQTVERPPASPKQIHITTLEIPVTYDAVLTQVPGFHARPPILPTPKDASVAIPTPPEKGYDFVMHVGVGRRGGLSLEKLAHKSGYSIPDVNGKYPPELVTTVATATTGNGSDKRTDVSDAEKYERDRSTAGPNEISETLRGFGKGYEGFADELRTELVVDELNQDLQEAGVQLVRVSTDAGRYLCDFIYYCSLAESLRQAEERGAGSKKTPVFFLHCCPVDDPLSTQQVTDAIERIVIWVGARL